MFQTIQGSAHDIAQVADKSVQLICTSPPYFGLRTYDGEQAIEWPTVEYAPMPGLTAIRVQGCEPGCNHEWGNELPNPKYDKRTGEQLQSTSTLGKSGYKNTAANSAFSAPDRKTPTQGAYCVHCGGWRGGLGLEPDPFAYVGHLILCLREWHRVLRDDGLCFVNLGDSYNGSGGAHAPGHANPGLSKSASRNGHERPAKIALPPKNLMQIPQRFALAAQADGWFVRNDIIWSKPNPMPESVTDRFTRSHEYIYMLAKSPTYYFDAEAVKEPYQSDPKWIEGALSGKWAKRTDGKRYNEQGSGLHNAGASYSIGMEGNGRNRRTVWTVAPKPFGAAHFACFPPEIPEICIRAGTAARGCCPACGAPWRRVVERTADIDASAKGSRFDHGKTAVNGNGRVQPGERFVKVAAGWEPTCTCDAGTIDCTACQGTGCDLEWFISAPPMTNEEHLAEAPKHVCPACGGSGTQKTTEPQPCVVLDPFSGSGTTGKVAVRLGRSYIGVDLSEKYLTEITEARMGAGVQMELSW